MVALKKPSKILLIHFLKSCFKVIFLNSQDNGFFVGVPYQESFDIYKLYYTVKRYLLNC